MIRTFRLLLATALAAALPAAMAQTPSTAALAGASAASQAAADDPNLWLEDILGDKALA